MSKDYEVNTRITFLLNFGNSEFNSLLLPDVQDRFVQHVKTAFEQDSTLGGGYVQGDLNFQFQGNRTVHLEYVFQCCDESRSEAESFSRYCVSGIRHKLESFGCQIKRIDCVVGEMDMAWFDQLEDAIFGPREPSAEKPAEEKTGKKLSSKKKNSRQER